MIKAAIMEVNPFHNGHQYFLSQIPKNEDDILIVIVSTTIVQRGEISVLNKHDKSKLLLDNFADIVIALPALLANQGGEYFAYYALKILKDLQIESLYFGSESNDLNFLKKTTFNQTKDFKNGIYNHGNENFKSNDILGISYIKAINKLNMDVEINPIKRITNNYNDLGINTNQTIASATSIRKNQANHDLIKNTLPDFSLKKLRKIDEQILFNIFKNNLSFCIDSDFKIFLSEDNQLLIRLQKIIISHHINSIEELINYASDKNNSRHKYRRIITNTILLVSKEEYDDNYSFIHLLGFTKNGQKYLKKINQPLVVTSLKQTTCFVARVEKRATNLYNIVTKQDKMHDYLPPVIKS